MYFTDLNDEGTVFISDLRTENGESGNRPTQNTTDSRWASYSSVIFI